MDASRPLVLLRVAALPFETLEPTAGSVRTTLWTSATLDFVFSQRPVSPSARSVAFAWLHDWPITDCGTVLSLPESIE